MLAHTITVVENATNRRRTGNRHPRKTHSTHTAATAGAGGPGAAATISGTPVTFRCIAPDREPWHVVQQPHQLTATNHFWAADSTGTTCAPITPAATVRPTPRPGQEATLRHTITVVEAVSTNIGGPGTGTPAPPTAPSSAPPVPVRLGAAGHLRHTGPGTDPDREPWHVVQQPHQLQLPMANVRQHGTARALLPPPPPTP